MKLAIWRYSFCCTLAGLFALPVAAETAHIYVANHAGTTVSVIDAATNRIIQTIEGVEAPEGVDFSPDGSQVYITSAGENVLTVVDRVKNRIIRKVPLSGRANDLVVTKDGKYVLVCIAEVPGAIDVIDTASLSLRKTIPSRDRMHDIVLTNDNRYAVGGAGEGGVVVVYDLARLEPAWEVDMGSGIRPLTLEHRPDGSPSRIFVNLGGFDGFAAIDFDTREVTARVRNPEPRGGGFGRSSDTSHGIGVAPDNKTLWVVSRVSNHVYVYSLPDLELLDGIPLPTLQLPRRAPIGASPHWITFTPDSKTAYVSVDVPQEVLPVDVETREILPVRIKLGPMPRRIRTLVLP